MDNFDVPLRILLGFILGGVIGLEREINEKIDLPSENNPKKNAVLGLRTFSLIGGLGAISGFIYPQYPVLFALIGLVFLGLIISFYILDSRNTGDYGMTTEVSLLFCFLTGFLLTIPTFPVQLTIAVTVILVLLMSRKEQIKDIVKEINQKEINAFVSFAILSFVVLPFLPNQGFGFSDFGSIGIFLKNVGLYSEKIINLELFNPFKLWLILVLITGIDLAGYVLERTVGRKKGWLLTSLVGGFVSSTATTVGIARESKIQKNSQLLLSAAFLANAVSMLPVIILLSTLNPAFLTAALPVILGIFAALSVLGGFFYFVSNKKDSGSAGKKNKDHQIINLSSALKFVGLFLIVTVVSKLSLEFFGSSGFLITSALGALSGVDAVVVNAAALAGNGVDMTTSVWAIVLINGVNLIAKSVYSFLQGTRKFAFRFLGGVSGVIAVSIAVALF